MKVSWVLKGTELSEILDDLWIAKCATFVALFPYPPPSKSKGGKTFASILQILLQLWIEAIQPKIPPAYFTISYYITKLITSAVLHWNFNHIPVSFTFKLGLQQITWSHRLPSSTIFPKSQEDCLCQPFHHSKLHAAPRTLPISSEVRKVKPSATVAAEVLTVPWSKL